MLGWFWVGLGSVWVGVVLVLARFWVGSGSVSGRFWIGSGLVWCQLCGRQCGCTRSSASSQTGLKMSQGKVFENVTVQYSMAL